MGFCRLLYWHVRQIILSFVNKDFAPFSCFWVPRYLTRGSLFICFGSFLTLLCIDGTLPKIGPDDPGSFLFLWVFGSPSLSASQHISTLCQVSFPEFHSHAELAGHDDRGAHVSLLGRFFRRGWWIWWRSAVLLWCLDRRNESCVWALTWIIRERERETGMLNAVFDRFLTIFEQIFTTATHPLDGFLNFQEIFIVIGVFLYVILIVEVGSISVRLSEYRVLCLHAVEQVLLCFAVITIVILAFAFAISGMPREAMICDIFRAYFAMHDMSMFEWTYSYSIILSYLWMYFADNSSLSK